MFTVFAFAEEYNKMRDIVNHLGPQMEDLVNLTLYNYPEKYRDQIMKHLSEPAFHRVIQNFVLEAYHELKNLEPRNMVDKWAIYHRALQKIKRYFLKMLKADTRLTEEGPKGSDIY